jgi:adenylate cyclase
MALGLLLLVGGVLAARRLPWPLPTGAPLAVLDKPSIVVLPFVNLSNDPQQEHLSDSITEELTTVLSKDSGLFVMARTSAFAYKDKAVTVQQMGQELGVRYVLEGSTRAVGDTVRITAQLVDASTGYHLWAERYDRALTDPFMLQEEISRQIGTALQVWLTEGEQARRRHDATERLDAQKIFGGSRVLAVRRPSETPAQGRQRFAQAVALGARVLAWAMPHGPL